MAVGEDGSAKFVHIALVLPTEFAYARGVLRGIIAATRERNLYTAGIPRRKFDDLPWLFRVYRGIYGHSSKYLTRWFKDWNPDGIICQIYDDRLAKVYREARKPVVELFESRSKSEFPRILPDDVATGELAARHFLERGFRHFAYFGAPWMLWSREREVGFHGEIEKAFRARTESGRADDSRPFTFTSYGSVASSVTAAFDGPNERRAAAMGDWLRSLPRPVALFSANDSWGFELLQAAREVGLHVPEDVAILGVDDEALLCEIAHPPLSSIRIGAEQIGRVAVSLLDQLLHRKRRSGKHTKGGADRSGHPAIHRCAGRGRFRCGRGPPAHSPERGEGIVRQATAGRGSGESADAGAAVHQRAGPHAAGGDPPNPHGAAPRFFCRPTCRFMRLPINADSRPRSTWRRVFCRRWE